MLTSAGWGRPQAFPNPLSDLDRIEVFRRTYGFSERGFGFGCQRPWIDEPARAQVGEDEPPYAGCAGRLAGLGRGRMPHGVSLLRSAVWTVRVVDEEVSQRTERVGRCVNEKRGLREGRQGGEQGSEPADVVEVAVTQEQVAHALQRNPGGLEATEQHGAAGGVDEHRLVTRERQSQARLRPLA